MVKTLTVIGTRPQYIKAAPVLKLLNNNITVDTGQHYDRKMSDIFIQELNIHIDYYLEICGDSVIHQMAKMIESLEKLIDKVKPDIVIVFGDTNSTVAGALVAKKKGVKLMHIEAGLRSYDRSMPEEINRLMVDSISDYLACPTEAVFNLMNIDKNNNAFFSGDTMLDIYLQYKDRISNDILEKYKIKEKDYYLCTIHRVATADNVDKLNDIFKAFKELGTKIVLPLHHRTKSTILNNNVDIPSNVMLVEPVSYIEMLSLIKYSKKVITDSGGLQKDAQFSMVPCVTLRDSTEWKETIYSGCNVLCEIDKQKIVDAINDDHVFTNINRMFGDGKASEKIVSYINEIKV